MTSNRSSTDVLIMGAGIAGPALAMSLLTYGFSVRLLERRPDPSSAAEGNAHSDGGSITLASNSIRGVLQCAAGASLGEHDWDIDSDLASNGSNGSTPTKAGEFEKRLRAVGFTYDRMGMYNDEGFKYGDVIIGDGEDGGISAIRIMRGDLRRLMLEECERRGCRVEWGVRVEKVEEGDEGVELILEDGSRIQGSILIGADGIHSRARSHILTSHNRPLIKPVWDNAIVVSGFIPRISVSVPSSSFTFPATIASASGFLMTVQINPSGDRLAWGINRGQQPERSRAELAEMERDGTAIRLAKEEYKQITSEPIRSLLDHVDEKSARVWAPYGLPEFDVWNTKRCVLVGDSAHAMPPNGQGTGMALEDAAYLSRLLGTHMSPAKKGKSDSEGGKGNENTSLTGKGSSERLEKIFKHYAVKRQARLAVIRKMAGKVGAYKQSVDKDSWAWWFKKNAVWLYITIWNRGTVRFEGFSGYDVMKQPVDVEGL